MSDNRYVCIKCDRTTDEWDSTCPSCGSHRSYSRASVTARTRAEMIITLGSYTPNPRDRVVTGFAPWDRLVGGGMVPGTTMVVGGNKGFGKSTLTLQLASLISAPTLIVSAEEQIESIAQRAARTGVLDTERREGKVSILHTNATEDLLYAIDVVDPLVVFVDSMNKFMSRRPDLGGTFGSGTQMKYLVDHVRDICDKRRKIGVIIGQVRSDGSIAGPNMIQHDVDAVFYIRKDPRDKALRRFSAVKNRLGDSEVVTIARMTARGLVDPLNGSDATYTELMLEDDVDDTTNDGDDALGVFDGEEDVDAVRERQQTPENSAKVVEMASRRPSTLR